MTEYYVDKDPDNAGFYSIFADRNLGYAIYEVAGKIGVRKAADKLCAFLNANPLDDDGK